MGVSSPNSASQIFKILFFRENRNSAFCNIVYCPAVLQYTLPYSGAGSRGGLRGRLGELGGVSEHRKRAAESCNVGDRSQFPTSKRLGTIAERHGAIPMLWEPLEPQKSRIRPPDPSLGRVPAALPSTIPSTSVEYTRGGRWRPACFFELAHSAGPGSRHPAGGGSAIFPFC